MTSQLAFEFMKGTLLVVIDYIERIEKIICLRSHQNCRIQILNNFVYPVYIACFTIICKKDACFHETNILTNEFTELLSHLSNIISTLYSGRVCIQLMHCRYGSSLNAINQKCNMFVKSLLFGGTYLSYRLRLIQLQLEYFSKYSDDSAVFTSCFHVKEAKNSCFIFNMMVDNEFCSENQKFVFIDGC